MAIKQYVSLNESLCGIETYKDTLNLATGDTTRQIKKLVLTGEESWVRTQNQKCYYINASTGCPTDYLKQAITTSICSHYQSQKNTASGSNEVVAGHFCFYTGGGFELYIGETTISSAADFKVYLQQQYANGTPVTIWYVLATPKTSTTTLPHGLSGIVEGSLTQASTPTPTNPVYPTANSIDAFLDKKYLKRETATDTITTLPKQIIGDGQSASAVIKGNLSQSGTPTPASPIYPSETGDLVATGEHSGQYQIPILSGGTTTNVYLGEVQSTRRIRKYEFTGDEAWGRNSGNSVLYLSIADGRSRNAITSMCTEYPAIANVSAYANMTDKTICIKSDGSAIWIKDTDIASTTDFKTHLAQQYANGTPVTVWYVLSTATTTTLNEPLRKIGNYADSVSASNLPTTGTAEQFDIDTTLKPSEVQLTYHGWHEHSDTKYTE